MGRILVVDDDEGIRDLLIRLLSDWGHEVVEVADGREALTAARKQPFDVVISDIFMPNADGLEMIRFLRRQKPELKIIAMSGGGSVGNMDILHAAKLMGAFRVLAKPFRAAEVRAMVDAALAPPPDAGAPSVPES